MFLIKNLNAFSVLLMANIAVCVPAAGAETAEELRKIFEQHEVVPDVIAQAPKQLLKVTYNNSVSVLKGAELTPTQVQAEPQVEWVAEPEALYTLLMIDPDAPSRAEPTLREIKHWLVGNIPGSDVATGEVIAAYRGSGPPQGSGLHRYVFLLYKQPGKLQFDEPRVGSRSRVSRINFKTAEFTAKYKLGEPVAGNFYQAQWDEYVPVLQQQTEA